MGKIKFIPKDGKYCRSCLEWKPYSEFWKDKASKDGYQSQCSVCHKQAKRKSYYLRSYGITIEDYNKMFAEQEGKCGICGTHSMEEYLCVDHDHKTMEVRGLLCQPCNLGLGKLGDTIESVENALNYLRR